MSRNRWCVPEEEEFESNQITKYKLVEEEDEIKKQNASNPEQSVR